MKSTTITSLKENNFDKMMWKLAILLEIFDIAGATLVPSANEREEMILLS